MSQPNTPQPKKERRPSQCDEIDSLSIVIPMGSRGTEFAEAGFRMPKPLVNIVGRLCYGCWITCAQPIQSFWPFRSRSCDSSTLTELWGACFLMLSSRLWYCFLKHAGWLETVLSVTRQMSAKESRNCLVTLNCSTIYHGETFCMYAEFLKAMLLCLQVPE